MFFTAPRKTSPFIVAGALTLSACQHSTSPIETPRTPSEPSASVPAGASAPVLLLHAQFAPRSIHQIEIGDFHFYPGQLAPVHTHAAPALGYVSKGSIIYQVEGQPVQTLHTGDAFFEPVGPQILHFDNASPTEEAVFTDFNFERTGEPFIVFPTPPKDRIDRRTFPTVECPNGPEVSVIDIYAQTLEPGASVQRPVRSVPVVGYLADGSISVRSSSGARTFGVGQSFDVPAGQADVSLTNSSTSARAKVVLFEPVH